MSRFDGSVLVNQRVVNSVTGHFKRRRLGQAASAALSLDDLMDLLYLIDLYVVCPTICIDGSLPPGDIEKLKAELAFLAAYGIEENNFTFKSPDSADDERTLCSLSAAQALKTFDDVTLDVRLDQRLDDKDTTALITAIDDTLKTLEPLRGASREYEEAAEVSRSFSTRRFRGSKAVAGFASLGHDSLLRIRRFVGGDSQNVACSALINRFRFFYLRQLGFRQGAIYSPGDRWEGLSNQQQLHFLSFVKQRLGASAHVQSLDARAADGLTPNQGEDVVFPPIALYALLTMEDGSERPLLERVAELRHEFKALRGYLARQTSDAMKTLVDPAILQSSNPRLEQEIVLAVGDFFAQRYRQLEFERRYGPDGSTAARVVKYTVPVIVSLTVGGVGLAVAGWMGAAVGAGLWGMAGDFLKEVTKDVVADRFDVSGNAALDQYRKLHFHVLRDPDTARRLQRIIRREFGCDLSLSAATS